MHSSPSFWSYRTCSTFPTVRARRAGGAPPQPARHLSRRAPSLTFIAPRGFECTLRPLSPTPSACTCDRTRKMVNYAWAGRSLRKLWWRSVAVLTCKSVKSVRKGPVKTLVLKRGTDFRSPAGYRQVPHPTVTDLEGTTKALSSKRDTNRNFVHQRCNDEALVLQSGHYNTLDLDREGYSQVHDLKRGHTNSFTLQRDIPNTAKSFVLKRGMAKSFVLKRGMAKSFVLKRGTVKNHVLQCSFS
ncbi:hypothetical protein NQZ68_025408 [Dissostichus eleginoides]|nr:hypothetical protein NQZ68_025408 [Dissostichus eleginoides]